ncbi:DegV family protein [Candidatus Saccharibacteria bacterium]|nr:DegV family protein [Candidatus Saccharibacteria bacterium]
MQKPYHIFTDTSSDLTAAELQELGVTCLPIGLTIAGEEYPNAEGYMPDADAFYEMQAAANGATSTAGVPAMAIVEAFKEVLERGEDVLYIGITPIMSSATWTSMNIALEELEEEYPDRRIEIPDTHSIAVGLGLVVAKMVAVQRSGATLDEALLALDDLSKKAAHWFSVDNLDQLKKSGRVSNIAAIIAGVLQIKPVMRLPYEGRLESVGKVRGKALLKEFAKVVGDTLVSDDEEVWLSYGGNSQLERANTLRDMIKELKPKARVSLHRIGPIIGAHTGETVLAVFFLATTR